MGQQIDTKTQELADTDEKNAQAKEDIADTRASLAADEQFLMMLKEKCQMTDSEWEERQKTRQQEMEAVSKALAFLTKNCQRELEKQVAGIESVMLEEVDRLIRKHRCVSQGRVIGAFGCLDLVNKEGHSLNLLGEALPREALVVKQSMQKRGLFGLFRSPMMHICPPLIITQEELRELFSRIHGVLTDLDAAL